MDSQARSDYPIAIRLSVKSQFVPDRLDGFQARSDYPIAIRLSVKSQFVPDRLDEFQARSDYPIAIRLSVKSNLSLIVWMNSQARSDYPIAIRLSVKSQFVPDRLDEFQARSDYPIAIRLSVKSQFVPDRLDGIPKPVSNPNLSLIVWMDSQARSDYPIAIRLSVKSQFVPDRLDNSQARSDYPIAIRLSVKSQFVPDRLDGFPSQAKTARQSESRIARYEQKSREGEVGSREEKGRKSDEMRAKGRAASFKVGPRAPSSRAARDDHAPVSTSAPNGPFEPPIASPHLVRSFSTFGISIWTRRTGTQTETNCAATVREHGNRENPERAKIESFILCPTFLVPRNAKQRRGNCHNPIFTPGIFSGVGTQNEAEPEPSPYDPTRAHRIKYSQKEGPGHISQAYLGGNVCAKILSDPLQLGPRAKTLRQEVHFSYHTQLSDRQELLRSSRNLSQKMTPWHKEHSDGLCSQGSYLANPSSPLCKACTVEKVFLTRNKLICEPGHVGKKTHSCTTWNSRIAKNLSGSAGILIGKLPSNGPKTPPVASARGAISHKSKLGFPRIRNLAKSRQRKLSDGTKNVKIRHRELGQICARTGTRFEKKRAGSKTHFFLPDSRLRAQSLSCSQQVDPRARVRWKDNDSGYVVELSVRRKHPPFDRNLHRKVHENSSDTPTSGSHNSSRPNSDSCKLYTVGKRTSRAFRRYACMTHFEFQKTSKTAPRKSGQKRNTRTRIEEDSRQLLAWKACHVRQRHHSRRTVMRAHDGCARGVHGFL
uniref:Uncharacterized protein n=1 Tax=Fagus sylvatica TaxID=28930 RepID=A0A2N9EJQ4_FAGSY